jgi:hypothetical protein
MDPIHYHPGAHEMLQTDMYCQLTLIAAVRLRSILLSSSTLNQARNHTIHQGVLHVASERKTWRRALQC